MVVLRKIISLILTATIFLCLVACSNVSETEATDESLLVEENSASSFVDATSPEETDIISQEAESLVSDSKVLVAYFSVTGNTEDVAERIAYVTGADIYEIVPAIAYTEADINYGDSDSRTSIEQNDPSIRPEIQSETISLEGYDTIYIGYPIWWGEEPRIMDTFVESYNFGDINIIPFCTSGSSGIGNSDDNLASNAGSGNWIEGQRFDANVSESEIEDWINGLQF